MTDRCGTGLLRALYATYISYLPKENLAMICLNLTLIVVFGFLRLTIVDNLVFLQHSQVTRGGHYHHTKSEKFLVVKGEVLGILTEEIKELHISSDNSMVVDTIQLVT